MQLRSPGGSAHAPGSGSTGSTDRRAALLHPVCQPEQDPEVHPEDQDLPGVEERQSKLLDEAEDCFGNSR